MKVLPGHADGQMVFWCEDNRTLFSGDIFAENGYLHFTDWPNTWNKNPLDDFFLSLKTIEGMNPHIIYPGHGKPLTTYTDFSQS
jgi:glyoxylase-like metal-dependent hydrolase (beta-lactamase superfamily II)